VIRNVALVNFISHGKTALPLRDGITVFVGKNGAGKSSVIDGITYALYGKHSRGDNAGLVKERAESASVTLDFTSGGKRFKVQRVVNKKGQLERSLLVEQLAGGDVRQLAAGERKQFGESMTGEVAKILGLNYEQMIVAGIIQQGELDSIIELKAKDLKDLVNSAIGIDRLDAAYDSMRDVTDSFRAVVRNRYGYDDQDLPKIVSEIAETEAALKTSLSELGRVESELASLREQEKALEDEVARLEPMRQKAELVRQRFEELAEYVESRKRELVEEKDRLGAEAASARRFLSLLEGEKAIGEREKDALKARNACENTLNDLSGRIAELEALRGRPKELAGIIKECRESLALTQEAGSISEGLEAAEALNSRLDAESAMVQSEIGKLEANEETAQKLVFRDHVCPICGSHVEKINELFDAKALEAHLGEKRARIKQLGEERRRAAAELRRLQERRAALDRASGLLDRHQVSGGRDLEKLEAERKELESRLLELPKLKEDQKSARDGKGKADRDLAELRRLSDELVEARAFLADHRISTPDDAQKLEAKVDVLGKAIGSIPRDLRRTLKTGDLGALESLSIDERSARLIEQVRSLSAEAERFDERAFSEKVAERNEITKVRIPEKSSEEGRARSGKEKAEKSLEVLRKASEDLRQVSEYVGFLERVRSRVYHRDGGVSRSVRSWALEQLSKKASEYARLFEIGVSSITIKETGRDMEIDCYGPRGHVRTSSMSGGEKVAIALALRFALAYVMGGYKLDFIILDEPTVHLDAERKTKLVKIISKLGGEESPLKQIIIITHDSEIFDNADVDEVWSFESGADGSRVRRGLQEDVSPVLDALSK
jgi:exonuclease SbcC